MTWKPVVGYESYYEVSESGDVRNIKTGNICKQRLVKTYPCVCLYDTKSHTVTTHSVVAAAFIGPRPKDLQVNHIDGVKTNNHFSNLEYVTSGENIRHAVRLGLGYIGEMNGSAKLTKDDVVAIRKMYVPRKFGSHRIAKIYGVTKRTIINVLNGHTWTSVPS